MLKKIAYAVITGGLLLVSLGASASVDESPFPVCDGKDCATLPQERIILASASKYVTQVNRHDQKDEAQAGTDDSAFPVDYSSSRD